MNIEPAGIHFALAGVQEYFTIQRDEWKAVRLNADPEPEYFVHVYVNGKRARQNVDYNRNAADARFFFFPGVRAGDLVEILYRSMLLT